MRTVSHDRGDHIEVVVYRDGVEISRTTKQKKNYKPKPATTPGPSPKWSAALKTNKNREPVCQNDDGDVGVTIKVACSCSASGEKEAVVHQCDIQSIKRCLPHFHPNAKDRATWAERKPESDIYQLCDACPHFQAKE